MDFQLTDEQKMLKTNVKAFLEREIVPAAQERDSRGPLTREETLGFIKQLMPFGYYNGWLSAEYGGSSLDRKTVGLLHEELSGAWASLAGTILMAGGSGAILAVSEARRQEMAGRVPRTFVDHVVTEHGIATLGGKALRERAGEMIAVADPDFRAELRVAAKRQNLM